MFNGKTATGWGDVPTPSRKDVTVQASLKGTSGTVTATVDVYVSNDPQFATDPANAPKSLAGSIVLSGTGSGLLSTSTVADSGGFALQTRWRYIAANLSAISGTGATATCSQWADA